MAKPNQKNSETPMFFSAFNYKLLGIAVLLVVGGFTAMYIENKVQGVISLYVAPIIIMIGYALVIFAIMKHDRNVDNEKGTE